MMFATVCLGIATACGFGILWMLCRDAPLYDEHLDFGDDE